MLFSQHTPTECMMTSRSMHAGKIFRRHFVEYCIHHYCLLFLFIFVTVLVCFVLASIASDPHSYFHGASLELLFCLFLCVYYCVCFRTPTFLLRPHSYFPVVSCVLPHPYFVASSFLFRFEYQQSLVRCLFPFEYQPLLVRWQFLHCPIFPRSCWDRIRHHTVPIRSMPVCVHIFPSY